MLAEYRPMRGALHTVRGVSAPVSDAQMQLTYPDKARGRRRQHAVSCYVVMATCPTSHPARCLVCDQVLSP
jgi:hypothetical protein